MPCPLRTNPPIVKSDGSFRSFTAALVILEFSFATNSTTSASDNARHLAFEESSSSNNWKIRLAASNFLLMIFPIFSRSAVEMNWIFSTSAIVFFTPNSLAVNQANIFVSELSVNAINASMSRIPSSFKRSTLRPSP